MNIISVASFLVICIPAVISTVHTTCYDYFLKKDGCVFSAAAQDQRCDAPKKDCSAPAPAITCPSVIKKQDRIPQLQRRYDNTNASFPIGGGTGICGFYDSNEVLGVCLWSGAEQVHPTLETAGWLNSRKTSNCGKRVYIQRRGRPDTVKQAKVIDGCSFEATSPDTGCLQIGLTLKLFNELNPTDEEKASQKIQEITWDFDNLNNHSPSQAPV